MIKIGAFITLILILSISPAEAQNPAFKAALEKHRPPETYNTVLRTLMFVYEIIFLWAFFQYLCYYEEKANYFKVLDQIRFQDKLANPDKCPCHRNGDWAPEPIFLLGNRENYYLYKCFCNSRGSPVGSRHPSSGSSTKWQNPLICPLANSTVQWLWTHCTNHVGFRMSSQGDNFSICFLYLKL